jgi:hypothetical protein
MNQLISNVWDHPKTSAAGILIAVVTVAGVLSQQGITLGNVGTGTVVTLISALATAFLGLMAKDPGESVAQDNSKAKLSAWILIAILVGGTMPTAGCSKESVAQDIVNWTPSLQSAVATVNSTAALLDPTNAAIFNAATAGFDSASKLMIAAAKAYLANPTASALQQLQAQVVALQQQVNTALLQAARITNTSSQQHVLTAIQAVATVVVTMLGLVQQVSSKTAVAQMAAASNVKLASVDRYLDREAAARMVAEHYGEPVLMARLQVNEVRLETMRAGF